MLSRLRKARGLLGLVLAMGSAAFLAPGCAKPEDEGPAAAESALENDLAPPMTVEAMIARAKTRDYWPKDEEWRAWPEDYRARVRAATTCQDFERFVFPDAAAEDAKRARELGVAPEKLDEKEQALRTDGVIVIKHGRILYERYAGAYAQHPEKRHPIWSASKSVTTGLVGAIAQKSEERAKGDPYAAQDGRLTRSGKPIRLDTPLSDLMDASELAADPRFGALTVEQLLAMAPNLQWSERYAGDITTSSILRMLWLDGPRDMAKLAANVPFGPEGPGNRFIYSSGNAVMMMRALRPVYGEAYDRMPWNLLFEPLGMKGVAFERDRQGTFVGSSYVHMPLRDLARFGWAYLNGGFFGGHQVIHPTFVRKAMELSIGMRAAGTKDEDITHEEGFYSLGFWINPRPEVLEQKGIRRFGPDFPRTKFFPSAPSDMFMAAGHYGQNVLVFPKDDLLIVRLSHDKEYWSKLDRMIAKGRSCFNEVLR